MRIAGAAPKIAVPASARSIAYPSTCQSGVKSNAIRDPNSSNGRINRGIVRVVQKAKIAAAAHAAPEIASPSAMKIVTMRARDAPKDCRTAISRARTTARASIRFATFAQTMKSVSAVMIENIARNHGPRCATTLSPAAVPEYGKS